VQQHVGIRMSHESFLPGDVHPSEDQLPSRHQAVDIITMANAHKLFTLYSSLFTAFKKTSARSKSSDVVILIFR